MPVWDDYTKRFINFGLYGDGDIYEGLGVTAFIARQEAHAHRLSLRLHYLAEVTVGAVESFHVLRATLQLAQDIYARFTHEAFLDQREFTNFLSLRIHQSGADMKISNTQLIAKVGHYENRE